MLRSPPLNKTLSISGEASPEILILFAVIACTFAIGAAGYYALGLHGGLPFPQDAAGYVLGRDFLNTWFFGKAAFLPDPGRFYDHDVYVRWINDVVPQDICVHVWSYPPSFLLMAAPFGLLSYPAALAAWTSTGVLTLYNVVRNRALQTLAILCSPAAIFCLINGQISLFMAAITLTALRTLDRRPLISGLLIALCTIKPQSGLLFPVLLIASRRWRVLAAATLGTLSLVLASSLLWGFDVWRDYVLIGLPTQIANTKDMSDGLAPWSPTMMTAMILAGLEPNIATAIQIVFTGLGAAFVAIGCAHGAMDERRIALFLACSIFAAPYLLAHDLVALTAAVVMLAAAEPLDRWGSAAAKAIFLLPMLQFAAAAAHVPGVAVIPICFALWALRRRDATPVAAVQATAVAL
ncbi:MAG: glycosyltransferase family 87 protein [Beijerinckiaceae bacterium]